MTGRTATVLAAGRSPTARRARRARSMLRAVGLSEEDFGKPQVAVASSWNEVTPCNYHLGKLAALAKEGVRQGDAVPIEFTTIAVSDAIAMGHEGMKASLMSRDLIADSVELVMHAERLDALVGIAGCDKSEPGMLMAMARLDLPSVYLYGGTILPGTYHGPRRHDPGRVRGGRRPREGSDRRRGARGARARRVPDNRFVRRHVHGQHDGVRRARRSACRSRAAPARPRSTTAARWPRASRGSLATGCSQLDLRPRQIMTKEAFENAIAVVMAVAGSTNAVLHLLAIAREAHVDLELDDFDRISRRTPHLVDVRPAGRFVMSDLDRVGGVPVVMKELLDIGSAARRLHDRDRARPRPRTSRRVPRRRPTARSCTRRASRSTRGAASRSCAATSPPTAP